MIMNVNGGTVRMCDGGTRRRKSDYTRLSRSFFVSLGTYSPGGGAL